MASWNQSPWNTQPWSPFGQAQSVIPPVGPVPINQGDNFISLYNRLLARCPAAGELLCQQFINDAWRTFQSRREWSFRRRNFTIAPPNLYNTGTVSSNVANGAPTLLTGVGTNWTPNMIGRQIRVGGYLYPFFTIIGWQSATAILIDQPWAGADVSGQSYQIMQLYYPMPPDFGFFYAIVSIKDGYRLWTSLTQADLALMDPQRTNFSQTYAVAFRDFSPVFGGIIGPVIPCTSPSDPSPISTTSLGYSYPVDATYIIQVVTGGVSGTATYKWLRAGQGAFSNPVTSSDQAQDLSDGVQIYWPDTVTYVANDIFTINAKALQAQSVPRYELWPGPTFQNFLYPAIYISKEYDLSVTAPWLPPFIAARGDVILEMALEKCAEFPGQDSDHPNIYHDLRQAQYHKAKYLDMLIDIERNDEENTVGNIDYQMYPFAPAPWLDAAWQQEHAPFLFG